MGVDRIIAQKPLPQHISGRCRIHRGSRMAGICLLHRVDGQHADGVDRQLIDIALTLPDAPRNKLYVDPLLPDWLPDITIRDLRLGRHKFDIRFWREGTQTEFEVLNGNAKLVERCEVGAKAAQLRDRTEPI